MRWHATSRTTPMIPSAGSQAYEAERLPRARAVQLQARQQFLNNRMSPAPPPLSRDWIFAHDATAEQSSQLPRVNAAATIGRCH